MNFSTGILLAIVTTIGCFQTLKYERTNVAQTFVDKPFYVAGIQVRTNNADEIGGRGRIGPLWQRFFRENLGAQIPNRVDSALTVVYSGYASDEKGDYDYLLGARVSSVDHLPAGMTFREVQSGPYAVVLTEVGKMPDVLQAAWREIWQSTPEELGGRRAFITDYEIYDSRSADPQHTQVEIHLGLKKTP
jgi:predicted transcriptional regulator YdeE